MGFTKKLRKAPGFSPDFYPQVSASMNSMRSWRHLQPRQMLIIPGSPSPRRPKNPPSLAIIKMAFPIDRIGPVLIFSFFADVLRTFIVILSNNLPGFVGQCSSHNLIAKL
jgi:hypothetical protein